MERVPSELPEIARDLAELIGLPATIVLVEQLGGTRQNVPRAFDPESDFVKAIGPAPAAEIARVYRGMQIDIPRCGARLRAERNHAIRRDAAELDANALATKYHLHLRQIRRILAEDDDGPDPRQYLLFR